MLYDASSGRITALLDYDFSSVLHPSQEFFASFRDVGGHLPPVSSGSSTFRAAKLSGDFPEPLPPSTEEEQWELAALWEQECKRQGVKRPSSIEGIEGVADVHALLEAILPWHVTNNDILALQSEDAVAKHRKEGEVELAKLLAHLGY